MKALDEIKNLTPEEKKVYAKGVKEFRTQLTYQNQVIKRIAESLARRYGLHQVEIYNRPYNKRQRELEDWYKAKGYD